ncbi:sugar ABC transporter substrate-binding protein [Actinokineospora globicatena]|uniref:Uncharacterized protein n=1 Tax=Actinokineospora globicatena TaxID=103729 RepID=A0A9W6VB38_9PSEU|nr:sugar ABC transporter substrate-binding protein [Actinokineospora globicatena]MCP2300544.1 hypothetical protein [Actinokineospora globicatena]GLW81087.1 hypothetical protein Aglo01_55680 [Actinokineospora globicatena]GLW88280.1 hypothetical protein Aglo02_59190 [Actinokineospora globicatena]GLW92751.1 hypothetical protein Aglo03_35670 [Actinokineospora globicatena]
MRTCREPTFLPLTLSTARTACATHGPAAQVVQATARRADSAAAECWAALLAGCDAPGRHQLPTRLRELAAAAATYATDGNRGRIDEARCRIEEAVADRDGEDFAEAFIGYDQAIAAAIARAHTRQESPTR